MIRQFRVQNFKALRDVTLDLTPIHVLIGPNDSGKSSILQALETLSRSSNQWISEPFFDGPWQLANEISEDDPLSLISRIEDERGPLEYKLQIALDPKGRKASWIQETFSTDRESEPKIIETRDGTCTSLCKISDEVAEFEFRDQEYIYPEDSSEVFRVWDALNHVRFIQFSADELVRPSECNATWAFQFLETGYGLPSFLGMLRSEERERFDALENRFLEIFPSVESIQILIKEDPHRRADDNSGVFAVTLPPRHALQFHFKDQSRPLAAYQVGSGMLYVLGYLALRYSLEAPSVFLIEEPEKGLHPERLAGIVKILRELIAELPQTQILLTTHSPYLVDEFQSEEVTVCYRDGEGEVKVRRLDHSPLVERQLDIFGLGEIWAAEGEKALMENLPEAPR